MTALPVAFEVLDRVDALAGEVLRSTVAEERDRMLSQALDRLETLRLAAGKNVYILQQLANLTWHLKAIVGDTDPNRRPTMHHVLCLQALDALRGPLVFGARRG